MNLSSDLISQFVKATKDDKKQPSETTVQGTIVYDGKPYVKLDGSDLLTPVSTTTDVEDGERVTVLIKNHTATVTGNLSSPSARTDTVKDLSNQITQFEIIVADKVSTEELDAERGRIDDLVSDNVLIRESLTAANAEIDELSADNVTINEKLTAREAEIKKLETEKLDANAADIKYATIESLEGISGEFHDLESTYAEFQKTVTDDLTAFDADIKNLDAEKLSADAADLRYANIDFSNIGEAAVRKIFSDTGLIEDLTVGDGTITGELVGVTIKGDLIEGGTVKADKLVVLGSDGLYYKLNFEAGTFAAGEQVPTDSLHGSIITAKSITAEKVSVKDLVAFGATIGGFTITNNSLYSGVKASIDNTTRGIYLGNDGQFAIGDGDSCIRYYEISEGEYRLEMRFGSGKNVEQALNDVYTKEESDATLAARTDELSQSISETYYTKSEQKDYADKIDSEIRDSESRVNTSLSSISDRVDATSSEMQSFREDIYNHVDIDDNGITIKALNGVMKLRIDSTTISFYKGEIDEKDLTKNRFGWWDGVNFHTGNIYIGLNERAQFGNFAFEPRDNGSLDFLKVGG